MRRGLAAAVAVVAAGALAWLVHARTLTPVVPPAPPGAPVRVARAGEARKVAPELRADAIARARVWHEPRVPLERALLDGGQPIDELACRFRFTRLGGTTPKFDCVLEDGETVRVKYGTGAEIPAEAAATRLLRALGFGADEVRLVEHLRCYGCPVEPFTIVKAVELAEAESLYTPAIDYSLVRDFTWVSIERKYDARPIETATQKGWALPELDGVDAARGGAPRAQVDALRLLAVFLAHWDNKADNQRLVCESREWPDGTPCSEPLMLLQDLGATFGPRKVNLRGWRSARIWADRPRCVLTMRHMPYSGATFMDVPIGESGRTFLAQRLGSLSDAQVAALFAGARFDRPRGLFSDIHPVDEWVDAFRERVAMISEGPPCPSP